MFYFDYVVTINNTHLFNQSVNVQLSLCQVRWILFWMIIKRLSFFFFFLIRFGVKISITFVQKLFFFNFGFENKTFFVQISASLMFNVVFDIDYCKNMMQWCTGLSFESKEWDFSILIDSLILFLKNLRENNQRLRQYNVKSNLFRSASFHYAPLQRLHFFT